MHVCYTKLNMRIWWTSTKRVPYVTNRKHWKPNRNSRRRGSTLRTSNKGITLNSNPPKPWNKLRKAKVWKMKVELLSRRKLSSQLGSNQEKEPNRDSKRKVWQKAQPGYSNESCPTGYYTNESCPTGYYTNESCPTGYYTNESCLTGYYTDESCPTGYYMNESCPTGYYMNESVHPGITWTRIVPNGIMKGRYMQTTEFI